MGPVLSCLLAAFSAGACQVKVTEGVEVIDKTARMIDVAADGSLSVADRGNHRIRIITHPAP